MGLRFSDDGPEFPVALIDAVLEGKAILDEFRAIISTASLDRSVAAPVEGA